MANIHFVLHPLPGSDEQLTERFRELGERINRYGLNTPSVLSLLRGGPAVQQIVVGPAHVAFLFDDGRVARVAFSVISDRLDLSRQDSASKTSSKAFANNASLKQTRQRGRLNRTAALRGAGGRGTGVIMGSARPVVPAQYVPEELVSQAQVVLQGKSRNVIIRELQRTNLDVNLAVNNLLSRDDEEGDDGEDSQDSYVSEDLMSLLDGGMSGAAADPVMLSDAVDAVFPEDMFAYSSLRTRSSTGARTIRHSERGATGEAASATDRDSFSRWRDRQYFGPRRWLENALREPWNNTSEAGGSHGEAKNSKSQNTTGQGTSSSSGNTNNHPISMNYNSPIWLSDEIEYWPDPCRNLKFTTITAMHSELIALGTNGQVYQWKWIDIEPYKHPENPHITHPRSIGLGFQNEKVICISSSSIRCSIASESGKVATWLDESIAHVASRLEHNAASFQDVLQGQKVTQLYTCSLYTLAKVESSNSLFWWGVLPFSQRNKLWEKYRSKTKRQTRANGGSAGQVNTSEISVGSQVLLRVAPMYQSGSIGFTVAGGIPKVGQLLNAAWSLTDKCRFKVLPGPPPQEIKKSEPRPSDAMPPPPSPASSTCSDSTAPSQKRVKKSVAVKDGAEKKDEEDWSLKDVVFVEDSKNIPIGRVLKIDGAYALVKFTQVSTSTTGKEQQQQQPPPPPLIKEEDVTSVLQDCRLLRLDDLQLVKNGNLPKSPDCIQKMPRKVHLSELSNILAMSVDSSGIHGVFRDGKRLLFKSYNLHTGKPDLESSFPSDINAFLGIDQGLISLDTNSDNDFMTILKDGNGTIYPLVKDCLEAIRDPVFVDLPPIICMGTGIHALPHVGSQQKNQVGVIVVSVEQQTLMSKILKCDVQGVSQLVKNINDDCKNKPAAHFNKILFEKCDGNRNIFHAAVCMAMPITNKDVVPDLGKAIVPAPTSGSSTSGGGGAGSSSNASGASSFGNLDTIENLSNVLSSSSAGQSNAATDGDDSNESTESNVILGFRGFGSSSPGPSSQLAGTSQSNQGIWDPTERIKNAISILEIIFECIALEQHFHQLLAEKDAKGQTPLMLAVSIRAYISGLILINNIVRTSKEKSPDSEAQKKILMSMVYPTGSLPDDSPLQVICCNDTCSFTWTGAEHINQDIFECRTCGLVGSLCCCTECARVCHKGHDCKLKRTSPTAYCDCWEKCKCKALVMGHQQARHNLLCKLINNTDLVSFSNSKGENILLSLVQTAGRQVAEQKQYRSSTRSRASSRKPADVDADMPEHDLQPPRFSRTALEQLLDDWAAVKAMVLSGASDPSCEDQSGTALLDKFTYRLMSKCPPEMTDTLLSTMIRELQSKVASRQIEAEQVVRRFIRSAARVFVIISVESAPSFKKGVIPTQIDCCRRIFQSLLTYSIQELCEMANSQIAPVQFGVARPTASYPLIPTTSDVTSGSEELFSADPLQANSERTHSESDSIADIALASTQRLDRNSSIVGVRSRLHQDVGAHDEGGETEGDQDGEEGMDEGDQHEPDADERRGVVVIPGSGEIILEPESDMELDLLAESESDSDDNQSNINDASSAQRSTQATAGSDTAGGVANLALFSDDSDESTQQEDEDDEEEDSDGNESDERDNAVVANNPTAPSSTATPPTAAAPAPAVSTNPPTNTAAAASANPAASAGTPSNAGSGAAGSSANAAAVSLDEFINEEQIFERRSSTAGGQRGNLAPSSMQWAIRTRETPTIRGTTTTGLVFIDHASGTMRRSAASSAVAAAAAAAANATEPVTMATTASGLARSFGIIMREIGDLLKYLQEYPTIVPRVSKKLEITQDDVQKLQEYLDRRLLNVWEWLLRVMDSTEAQLRFGGSLSTAPDQVRPTKPLLIVTRGESGRAGRDRDIEIAARREFLSYSLSLMRAHNAEHLDSLPVIDVSSFKHVAYVFDSLIYFLRSVNDSNGSSNKDDDFDSLIVHDPDEPDDMTFNAASQSGLTNVEIGDFDDETSQVVIAAKTAGKRHTFFQRSDSTLCLGCPPPDPFQGPVNESLPLAEKPHLLQPNVRKDELFGIPKSIENSSLMEIKASQLGLTSRDESPPSYAPLLEKRTRTVQSDEKPDETGIGGNIKKLNIQQQQQEIKTKAKNTTTVDIKPTKITSDSRSEEVKISLVDTASISNVSSVLSKPPPLVKITPVEGTSSSATTVLSIPKWGSPQSAPQDLSITSRTETTESDNTGSGGIISPKIQRAPIIVSTKRLSPTPSGSSSSSDSAANRAIGKSVIVCNRQISSGNDGAEILVVPMETEVTAHIAGETEVRAISSSSPLKLPTLTPVSSSKSVDSVIVVPPQNQIALFNASMISDDVLLGRWRLTLELFGRVFVDDVGLEPGSVISELGGFPVKESRFRREMEKIRNAQQRDLTLSKLERDRNLLLIATFKELNNHYNSAHRRATSAHPPLAINRVKVTFKDEPGEGSGVARSFYTAIAEAILLDEKLPSLEGCLVGSKYSSNSQFNVLQRLRLREDYLRRGSQQVRIVKRGTPRVREIRRNLSYDARPFHPASSSGEGTSNPATLNDHLSNHLQQLGERVFAKVHAVRPNLSPKITGMLLELPPPQLLILLASEETLKQRIDEAVDIILTHSREVPGDALLADLDVFNFSKNSSGASSGTTTAVGTKKTTTEGTEEVVDDDNTPLFYQPGKRGFFSPRLGKPSAERLNAFRNVGRIIGLCLLQNELCPMFLNRHVLKFILGRPIKFHDMAFFDAVMYESFRQLILDAENKDGDRIFSAMELTFSLDLCPEEGGRNVELITGGRNIEVTEQNVYDYVRKYADYRMVRSQYKALEEMRNGVLDVLPPTSLDGLTSEDLRLLLNGVGDINVATLISYTSFNDESGESSDKLTRFKKWLWSIVEKMSNLERQELVYFWTGSPALPASEDGFQPMPTVTIRPADDNHLPTANTCISRLYIPLYSSRYILRNKLLLAIKTKNFGFV